MSCFTTSDDHTAPYERHKLQRGWTFEDLDVLEDYMESFGYEVMLSYGDEEGGVHVLFKRKARSC